MKLPVRIVVAIACLAATGCWPWSQSETPQQRYIEALNRGHSAEASQIWLHMSAKDKLQFAHSQNMQPGSNPNEVKKLVQQHYKDQTEGTEGAQASGNETTESLGTSISGAGLQNLPSLAEPPAPQPAGN